MRGRLPWSRRKLTAPIEPRPPLPALDLLLRVAMQERELQLAHFDALDVKAGVLLAFDGVLIVVSHGIRFAFQLPGIALASASAALALAAIFPRKFATIDPWVFRQFLTYDTESAGLKLHDTIAETVTLGGKVLRIKARNLKLALILLLLAVLTFAAGTAFTTYDATARKSGHDGLHARAGSSAMSLWVPWLTVVALALAAVGTAWQALIALGEFRRLQRAMIRAQEAEFSRETHPSHSPKQPGALGAYFLYRAPDPVRTAAWFTKSVRRFPRALARLKQSDEAKAELVRFTRQALSWGLLMVGSLCALAAALISLIAAY